jgi:hypothetical protein
MTPQTTATLPGNGGAVDGADACEKARTFPDASMETVMSRNVMSMSNVPLAFAVNRLRGIDHVEPRLASEDRMFGEVLEVLRRHGAEKKYGLALLHKHFDLADDEVLMEYTDLQNRTLITMPAPRSKVSGDAVETMWSLAGGPATVCVGFCYYYPATGHVGKHEYGNDGE